MGIGPSIENVKLYYFDIPGKAEAIRLALSYCEIPFEDIRLTREEFNEKKLSGELAFGQVPLLKVGDEAVVQSNNILRLIGKLSGKVYPSDPLQAAKVDAILDQLNDAFTGVVVEKYGRRFGFELDEHTSSEVRSLIASDVMPRHFDYFTSLLKSSPTFWIAGTENPSIADFAFVTAYEIFCITRADVPEYQEVVSGIRESPEFSAIRHKFYNLPSVIQWYHDHDEEKE